MPLYTLTIDIVSERPIDNDRLEQHVREALYYGGPYDAGEGPTEFPPPGVFVSLSGSYQGGDQMDVRRIRMGAGAGALSGYVPGYVRQSDPQGLVNARGALDAALR
jgi:hypothetical protein